MSGNKTGILVTKGFEDIIAQGRGSQTFIDAQLKNGLLARKRGDMS